ncbi:MAG: hypothetical protein WB785_07520 [Mycobacterium sp.]|uniref:hypothetical protein n=1 Tax=Mycobacterium sp. TaxID=1785 RepID=UPI003C358D23
MLSAVYVVWAIFLFRSARAPSANRLFLDFNLTANAAHFAVMFVLFTANLLLPPGTGPRTGLP